MSLFKEQKKKFFLRTHLKGNASVFDIRLFNREMRTTEQTILKL